MTISDGKRSYSWAPGITQLQITNEGITAFGPHGSQIMDVIVRDHCEHCGHSDFIVVPKIAKNMAEAEAFGWVTEIEPQHPRRGT